MRGTDCERLIDLIGLNDIKNSWFKLKRNNRWLCNCRSKGRRKSSIRLYSSCRQLKYQRASQRISLMRMISARITSSWRRMTRWRKSRKLQARWLSSIVSETTPLSHFRMSSYSCRKGRFHQVRRWQRVPQLFIGTSESADVKWVKSETLTRSCFTAAWHRRMRLRLIEFLVEKPKSPITQRSTCKSSRCLRRWTRKLTKFI